MGRSRSRTGTTVRLFVRFALLSLLPVVVLGGLLANQYRDEVQHRGIEMGTQQATVIARLLDESVLPAGPVPETLDPSVRGQLRLLSASETGAGHVARLRLRDADAHVVFADDQLRPQPAASQPPPDDDALAALAGHTESELTRLNSDGDDSGPVGPRVVETYTPLYDPLTGRPRGVLELYVPYDQIAHELAVGLHRLYVSLAAGLGLLYLALAGISAWMTRRLTSHALDLQHVAEHDALTGLPNRALLRRHVADQVALARTRPTRAAVALLDLDRFREVNDTLGQHNGDALLRRVGDRLAAALRPQDVVARLGGDEFALLLPGVGDERSARAALGPVRAAVEDELDLVGLPLSLQASIGVALLPYDGDTADQLLQHADVAMYHAKQQRTGLTFFDPTMADHDAERLALVAELRRAIERDELVLHYQPQVHQPTSRVTTVEALVRWQHPTRGLLAPDQFVPVAEQTGLVDDLTRWVLDEALAELGRLESTAPGLQVAVNVSARSLQREDFPATVVDALRRSGVPADRLLLEITETALVTDAARATAVLAELHAAGLRLSLDDFGQGYTSLGQLRGLPLSELKIDKSFVLGMLGSTSDAAIVRSVVELGHNLGMSVVAEGVETEQVLSSLRGMGCDVTQGYFFSRPLPPDQLRAWLRSGARTPVPSA